LGEIPFEPWKEEYTLCTKILGYSNGLSWLIGLSWLVNMYILIRGYGLEWHVYLLTNQHGWNDLFDYLLTWTSSQIGQKFDNLGQKWPMTLSQMEYLIKLERNTCHL
jgi:hypothetical protein